ncbi:MAG: Hpt domain-containing protein [Acidobacteriota bacterium]
MASRQEMSGDDLLDAATLETLAQLGERRGRDLLGQLAALFSEQGPKSFATLRRAVADADTAAIRDTAHSLKGSYRSLGTLRLADLSAELESLGRRGVLDGVEALLDDLEASFAATEVALRGFIEGRKNAS